MTNININSPCNTYQSGYSASSCSPPWRCNNSSTLVASSARSHAHTAPPLQSPSCTAPTCTFTSSYRTHLPGNSASSSSPLCKCSSLSTLATSSGTITCSCSYRTHLYSHVLVPHPPVKEFCQQQLPFAQVKQLITPGHKERYACSYSTHLYGHVLVQHQHVHS